MSRLPPGSPRTATLCPCTPLFRSSEGAEVVVAQVVEARVLAEELELDRPGRAVSLLADDDLGQPLVRRVFLVVVLVAVDEDDHVRILLDGAGFAQVRHYRTLVGAGDRKSTRLNSSH